jgi:hypothetical protein
MPTLQHHNTLALRCRLSGHRQLTLSANCSSSPDENIRFCATYYIHYNVWTLMMFKRIWIKTLLHFKFLLFSTASRQRLVRESDQSPPSGAEVKNGGATPPLSRLHGVVLN